MDLRSTRCWDNLCWTLFGSEIVVSMNFKLTCVRARLGMNLFLFLNTNNGTSQDNTIRGYGFTINTLLGQFISDVVCKCNCCFLKKNDAFTPLFVFSHECVFNFEFTLEGDLHVEAHI